MRETQAIRKINLFLSTLREQKNKKSKATDAKKKEKKEKETNLNSTKLN